MRKVSCLLLCLILRVWAAVPASAATGVSAGIFTASVTQDGNCQVTLDLQIHLDGTAGDLVFPLPGSARSITVNGNPAKTSRSGDVMNVKLSSVLGNVSGDFNLRLQYTIADAVAYGQDNKYLLTLPILSGFNFPIDNLQFSIQLPGAFTARPDFVSGYYAQTIESSINYSQTENTITGTVDTQLKDRETLTMTLVVPGDHFPNTHSTQWTPGVVEVIMAVLAVFAAVYWLLFLRSLPFLSLRSTTAPEGYNAGELSRILNGMGSDLTMMVFSWAQLGYIHIQYTDTGRVILHKRMEMGNERDPEEMRLFKALFGKRRFVDGTGYHYAHLCKKASAVSSVRHLYRRTTGNPRVFRGLCTAAGFFGGISLGRAIVGDAILGVLLIAILAVAGGISAWMIQDWVRGLHLRDKFSMGLAFALCLLWILIGLCAGIVGIALAVVALQLLCGLGSAYGGLRTPVGRQTVTQMLGLRRYLKRMSPEEASKLIRRDPDYFFTMLPYAMALGVEKPFAKSFRGRPIEPCSYLSTGSYHRLTALEWAQLTGQIAAALDAQQRRLSLEKLFLK